MHPVVKAAVACAAITGVGLLVPPRPTPSASSGASSAAAPPLQQMPCPPRHLPEGDSCVPVPAVDRALGAPDDLMRDQRPRGPAIDVIPRRPDRPEDPALLRFPLPELRLLRGFSDLSAPDQDLKSPLSVELSAERGAVAFALLLDGQQEKTRVLAVGRHFGNTVVTAHDVPEADGRVRTLLLVYGHLDAVGPEVKAGVTLASDATVGFVGDSGSPGLVRLYLEARRVREEQETKDLPIARLLESATSVPIDLRNVLASRPAP